MPPAPPGSAVGSWLAPGELIKASTTIFDSKSFDLKWRRRLALGGFKAFLGKICPKPRGLSATSPAPEVLLGAPQRAIFAFRSRKGASWDFFPGAKGASSFFFFAGQKGLAPRARLIGQGQAAPSRDATAQDREAVAG